MSDFEIAVSRLTAWIRDYEKTTPKVFMGDVILVLMAAKGAARTDEELRALQSLVVEYLAAEESFYRTEHAEDCIRKNSIRATLKQALRAAAPN